MSISQMFEEFIDNLAISNKQTISDRYAELTKTLNKQFRNTDSETANTLQVGSFGRKTGINGISDLDMLYIMPKSSWDTYKNAQNGQYKLLSDTKEAILNRYSRTAVSVDRLVVTVTFSNFYIEVQPVFEQEDGSFKYPDTKNGGSWKITKPREEIDEISSADKDKNQNLRRLCKMARAWKNKHGVAMGGLLIDTLVYNFLKLTDYYDDKSYMIKRIIELREHLRTIKNLKPATALRYIRNVVGYDEYIEEYCDMNCIESDDCYTILGDLENSASEFNTFNDWFIHMEEYKNELIEARKKSNEDDTGVRLMTFHSSKGLEFDIVYIIDVNEGSVPYKKAKGAEEIEEERRMFYVAMTRARHKLFICYCKENFGKSIGKSDFIVELSSKKRP